MISSSFTRATGLPLASLSVVVLLPALNPLSTAWLTDIGTPRTTAEPVVVPVVIAAVAAAAAAGDSGADALDPEEELRKGAAERGEEVPPPSRRPSMRPCVRFARNDVTGELTRAPPARMLDGTTLRIAAVPPAAADGVSCRISTADLACLVADIWNEVCDAFEFALKFRPC